MLYALLIYQDEDVVTQFSDAERQAALAAHRALQERAKAAGHFVAANELMSTAAATSVRTRGQDYELMDGPFAESKEVFVGSYVFECDNLDQAVQYAKMIPLYGAGGVEVRPIAHYEATARVTAP